MATPTTSPSSASAGAYSTLGLLGASSADGLYRRLAGFSGAPSRLVPAWWAEELAERFVTELGVAGNPDKLIDLDAASLVAALRTVCPTDLGVRGGMDNQSLGVVLDAEQPGGLLHAHPLEVLASGSHMPARRCGHEGASVADSLNLSSCNGKGRRCALMIWCWLGGAGGHAA